MLTVFKIVSVFRLDQVMDWSLWDHIH